VSADRHMPKGKPMDWGAFSREQFIRLGAAVGFGAAGASIMAACTKAASHEKSAKATGNPAQAPAKTKSGGTRKGGKGQAIAKESEVETNAALPFRDSETGQPAVLVHLQNGGFVAYSAVCTHQGCTVAYKKQPRRLICPCHGAVYDPANDAAVESGPAPSPLQEIAVEVRDGEVVRV
jgi:Rieske Fe-S protein